jgi:uncharacterized protein
MISPAPRAGRAATPADLDDALRSVARSLGSARRVGVAYSGGVDSTLLLALCLRVLGAAQAPAILAVSGSLADDERVAAHETARFLGAEVVELRTRELDLVDYRANPVDRCFFCKDELFSRIDAELVRRLRLDAVAYGENADDTRRPDRPGARAATRHRVLRPLADARITKVDVRRLARDLALPNADKPAVPCLASRIPHRQPVTVGKLAAIERAEAAVRRLGIGELRVRHHGAQARVEIGATDLERALREPLHAAVVKAVQACGFSQVTVDTGGLRSGAFTLAELATNPGSKR